MLDFNEKKGFILQGFYRMPIVYLILNLYYILVRNLKMEIKI